MTDKEWIVKLGIINLTCAAMTSTDPSVIFLGMLSMYEHRAVMNHVHLYFPVYAEWLCGDPKRELICERCFVMRSAASVVDFVRCLLSQKRRCVRRCQMVALIASKAR